MNTLILRWPGADHSLQFAHVNDKLMHGTLKIRKRGGNQTLSVQMPDNISIPQIAAAWQKQGHQWLQIFEDKGDAYEAVRFIEIVDDSGVTVTIVWYLYHKDDRPADVFEVWIDTPREEILSAFIDPYLQK